LTVATPHEEKLSGLTKKPPVVFVATSTHSLQGMSGSLRTGPFVASSLTVKVKEPEFPSMTMNG
jgi:hypothetical protein